MCKISVHKMMSVSEMQSEWPFQETWQIPPVSIRGTD